MRLPARTLGTKNYKAKKVIIEDGTTRTIITAFDQGRPEEEMVEVYYSEDGMPYQHYIIHDAFDNEMPVLKNDGSRQTAPDYEYYPVNDYYLDDSGWNDHVTLRKK